MKPSIKAAPTLILNRGRPQSEPAMSPAKTGCQLATTLRFRPVSSPTQAPPPKGRGAAKKRAAAWQETSKVSRTRPTRWGFKNRSEHKHVDDGSLRTLVQKAPYKAARF